MYSKNTLKYEYEILSKAQSFEEGITELGLHKRQKTIENEVVNTLLATVHTEGLHYQNTTNLKMLKLIDHIITLKQNEQKTAITQRQYTLLSQLKNELQTNPDLNNQITQYFLHDNKEMPYLDERIDFFTKPVAHNGQKYQFTTEKFRGHVESFLQGIPKKTVLSVDNIVTHIETDIILTEMGREKHGKQYTQQPEYVLQSIDAVHGLKLFKKMHEERKKQSLVTYTSALDQRQRMIDIDKKQIIDRVFDLDDPNNQKAIIISTIEQQFVMNENYHDVLISLLRPLNNPNKLLLTKNSKIITSVEGVSMQPISLHKEGKIVYCFGYLEGQPENTQLYCSDGIFKYYIDNRKKRQSIRKIISVDDHTGMVTLLHRNGWKCVRPIDTLRYD